MPFKFHRIRLRRRSTRCISTLSVGLHRTTVYTAAVIAAAMFAAAPARADAPATTVAYQPMVSAGLAAKQPFEAWLVFDKSSDPTVPGYDVPAGATNPK